MIEGEELLAMFRTLYGNHNSEREKTAAVCSEKSERDCTDIKGAQAE